MPQYRDPVLDDVDHVFFDLFGTLLDLIGEDTDSLGPYEQLSRFLFLRGVAVDPSDMRARMKEEIQRSLRASECEHPDVDMADVFSVVLSPHIPLGDDVDTRLREAALVFRVASTREHVPVVGMIAVVDALVDAGMPTSLVSNTQRVYSEHELRAIGLESAFETVVFSSDVRACKPDPAPFVRALELTGVDPTRALYIGDNPVDDVLGADGVGMRSVLFDRGRERTDSGPQPVAVIGPNEPERLLELVGVA